MERPSKRARVDNDEAVPEPSRGSLPLSLTRPISPVGKRAQLTETAEAPVASPGLKLVESPFQLTAIRDLPPSLNVDAVTLKDILGDPLISECWEFNYLHDIDFLMTAFDEDVRSLVKVHVIHGFWKQDDPSRQQLQVGFCSCPLPL